MIIKDFLRLIMCQKKNSNNLILKLLLLQTSMIKVYHPPSSSGALSLQSTVSCSPQSLASASSIQEVLSLLGINPDGQSQNPTLSSSSVN